MCGNAAIFIDGGYINKINRGVKLDYGKMFNALAGNMGLWRAYYYDCLPYDDKSDSSKTLRDNKNRFINALRRIDRTEVRIGKLKQRGSQERPYYVQKRVDLMLGLDIASVVLSGHVKAIVLLAGDGDLVPAVEVAKRGNVIVRLAHGDKSTYDEELWENADERILIDDEFIRNVSMG